MAGQSKGSGVPRRASSAVLPREERRAAFQAVDLRDQRILPQARRDVKEFHVQNVSRIDEQVKNR